MPRSASISLALTTALLLSTALACTEEDGGDGPEAGDTGDGDGDPGDGDGDGDPGDGDGEAGDGDGDPGDGDGDGDPGDGDGDAPVPLPCPGGSMPTNEAALIAWLESGEYLSWLAESSVHAGAGPHFGGVRTFVDACLAGALNNDDARPLGAAAVKELYGNGDDLLGWAVMAKVALGEGADTWYWFEVYQNTIFADAIGAGLCANCHSAGDDYFLSPWPLQ